MRIAGRYVRATVRAGDTATDATAALKAAIDAMAAELPVRATAGANALSLEAVSPGANGNDIRHEVIAAPEGMTVATSGCR